MSQIVMKFGGSSVADAASILRVAKRIVHTKNAGNEVVVVVSAMGDTTDELLDLAKEVSPNPPGRELDMLLTAGERISMAVLAMAISDLGVEARSYTGSQAGLITDSTHGKARIVDVTPGRIKEALADGAIPIIAGFQGVAQDTKDITTLGRGGSDLTAVAIAAALNADVCEIFTDVGLNVTTLPEEPVDQVVGIMLFYKLNAIMEGRMKITELVLSSEAGDSIEYFHNENEMTDLFPESGWWHEPTLCHSSVELEDEEEKQNVVDLNADDEWRDQDLGWAQAEVTQDLGQVVFANFNQSSNETKH